MRYVVTGSSGFIGWHLVNELEQLGHEVVPIDRLNGPVHELINTEWADIAMSGGTPNGVFHLAALAGVQTPAFEVYQNNILSTVRVLELCRTYGIPLVFTSSCAVYNSTMVGDQAWSDYGYSKVICEQLICGLSSPHRICRLSNVYGFQRRPKAVVGQWMKAIKTGARPAIFGGGFQQRDFIYVDDVVNGLMVAMGHMMGPSVEDRRGGSAVDLCTGVRTSIQSLAELLCSIKRDLAGRFEYVGGTGMFVGSLVPRGDPHSAQTDLGWQPTITLHEGIVRTLDAFGISLSPDKR